MVRKISFLILLITLLILPTVFSLDTLITIKTKPDHEVTIRVLDIELVKEFKVFQEKSNSEGEVSVVFSEDVGKISLSVMVKKDGKIITLPGGKNFERFGEYVTGKPILIDLTETETTAPANETKEIAKNNSEDIEIESLKTEGIASESEKSQATVEDNAESEEIRNKTSITGAVISGGKKVIFSKITYYVIGGIFAFVILFLVIFIAGKKLRSKKGRYIDFKIVSGDDKIRWDKTKDRRLLDAEKKLQEAKKELDEIRDKKKRADEIRERLERDRRELERLEREN